MATIEFTVSHRFAASSRVVFDEMIDWPGHAAWIPATRVDVDPGDPSVVGATFTAYTGYGPLTLVDRMRLSKVDWDEGTAHGSCEVEKLGPVLRGRAGFVVVPDGAGSTVEWFEDVTVPHVPQFLAPIVARLSALGFSLGMRRLAKVIRNKP